MAVEEGEEKSQWEYLKTAHWSIRWANGKEPCISWSCFRWLVKKGRTDEARAVLKRIRAQGYDCDQVTPHQGVTKRCRLSWRPRIWVQMRVFNLRTITHCLMNKMNFKLIWLIGRGSPEWSSIFDRNRISTKAHQKIFIWKYAIYRREIKQCLYTPSQFLSVTVPIGDTHSNTGGPARLPAKVAGRWGHLL